MFLILLISLLYAKSALAQVNSWNYACDSLICDPPKTCVVQDQVAQCLLLTDQSTISTLGSFFSSTKAPETTTFLPTFPNIFGGIGGPPGDSSTQSPFAPLLSFFSPGAPLTLPTLPTPTTTTNKPKSDICELPPLTGNCSKARIMWYYDTETGKCERFSYSGCGNENRFPSKIQCEQRCPGLG